MPLKQNIQEALNQHINGEFYSSYLYLAMAAYFESTNLKGFAHWMKVQAVEERDHALRLFDYIYDRGGSVSLKEIAAPKQQWNSPFQVFEETCSHEEKVTQSIGNMVELAQMEKDHATFQMLQWFVAEQVEEEARAQEIMLKLKSLGSSTGGLLYLDKELKKRELGQ